MKNIQFSVRHLLGAHSAGGNFFIKKYKKKTESILLNSVFLEVGGVEPPSMLANQASLQAY